MVLKKYFLVWFFFVWSFSELIQPSYCKQLDEDEVRTLRKIAVTMGSNLELNCEQSYGVNITCDYCNHDSKFCHITEMRLKDLGLDGTLPPELVDLTYLKVFDITRNFLHGPLPVIWSTMNLNFISLTANLLSGEIPVEWGNFPNLTYLSFEANNLSGNIPKELGKLVNLTQLFFSSNKFVGTVPESFANLKKLRDFRLSDNNFEGLIPGFIANFTDLNRLELFASGLKGPIPSIFQNLRSLKQLLITDMVGAEAQFPIINSTATEINLVLRNVNLSGTIPNDIWINIVPNLDMLDVSFNNLEGQPNPVTNTAKHIILSGNKLNGSIPYSYLLNSMRHNIDLSYNNFTWSTSNCQRDLGRMNTYRSFLSENKNRLFPCSEQPNCRLSRRSSLHINCGGSRVTTTNSNGSLDYEADTLDGFDSAKSYSNTYWGFSSTGDFMDDSDSDRQYIKTEDQASDLGPLYTTARRSPLSLTYFACLENGAYTVKLHFAEIEFGKLKRIGRRLFDIYIQGNRVTRDFNIDEEANKGGTKAVVKEYLNVSVIDNTLDIRFYWAGKGTRIVPKRGNYGILISAISVCPSYRSHCEEQKSNNNLPIVIGVVASVICLSFLVASFVLWKRRRRNIHAREISALPGLEMIAGSFTLRQLKAATNNFDPENKIGEGGFGSVYKGQLSDGTFIAVKQLSSKSRQGNREFVTEIGMITGLQHPNLVKLYGCCIARNQLLLVYEYMENNCLGRALFGGPRKCRMKLDWATRFKICVGIAKGLFFLHEGSPLKIVHRDIKLNNVLLDKDLNPKISDFGLAKLFEEESTHVSTRIAGTIGYMAPEYALWGNLSEKADVYSFGVVALEIVSGQSNTNSMPAFA